MAATRVHRGSFIANLDEDPIETRTDGTWQYPLLVSSAELEVFTVSVRVSGCHCYWRVLLKVNLPRQRISDNRCR